MSEPTDPLNTENTNPQRQAENQANRRKPQATRQNKANRPSLGQNILGFIKIAFATAFGIGIFICIMGFLFLIVGATSSSEIEIAEKSVLKISLGQSIVEYSKNDPVADLMAELQGGSTPLSLVNIKSSTQKS